MNRFKYIDALRGWAIFGVLVVHTSQHIQGLSPWLKQLTFEGQRGVQLFYVISAFTLFSSLSSRQDSESRPVLKFFVRRFFRIAPLFYTVLIFYLVKSMVNTQSWLSNRHNDLNLITHIFFLNGLNPYFINTLVPVGWSVAVETTFYLLVPFLFTKIKTLNNAIVFTSGTLLFSIVVDTFLLQHRLISATNEWNDYLYFWLPSQLPVFALGFVLFFLSKNQPNKYGKTISILYAISIFALLILSIRKEFFFSYFIFGLAFVLLAYLLSQYPLKPLVNRFWAYLGKISYSAYLIHIAVVPSSLSLIQYCLKIINLSASPGILYIILLSVTLVFTMCISTLTYRIIELPGMALGKRLILILNAGKNEPTFQSLKIS